MPQTINRPARASYGAGQVQLFSFLFKGFLVMISPILGLGLLKIIFFVFTNPKYFFFAWLLILAIGLVAEFFTDTWRPSTFATRNNQPAQPNSSGHSSNAQNSRNDDRPVTENMSPTELFKSQAAIASRTIADKIAGAVLNSEEILEKSSGVEDVSSEETTLSTVQVETRVKIGSRSRSGSPSPRSRSSSGPKGYGKPILLRMDYKLESSRSSPKGAVEEDNANQSFSIDSSKKEHKKRSQIHSIVPSDIKNSEKKTIIRSSEENLIDHLNFSSMINVDDENNFPEKSPDQHETKNYVEVETASKEWGILMYQNSNNDNVQVEVAVEATEGGPQKKLA